MDTHERPMDFHPQDWIIVIEALAQWAGPQECVAQERRERAYELIEAIAAEQGLSPSEMIWQVSLEWGFSGVLLK